MATQGRTGFQDSVGNGAFETIFAAPTNGSPLRGVELSAQTQDVLVRITGIHEDSPPNAPATITSERLVAGAVPTQRWGFIGDYGLITKIEAKSVVAGGKLTWAPISTGR